MGLSFVQGRRRKRSTFGLDEDAEGADQPSYKATMIHKMRTEHMFSKIEYL